MQHITLPSGATADLRDVADVTERMRRPVKRLQTRLTAIPEFARAVADANAAQAQDMSDLTPAQQLEIAAGMGAAFDVLEDLNDALCAALVAGWSFPFAVSADGMQDLPGRDLDALRTACGPFLPQLNPDFEPSPDPASPIAPSTV